MTTTNTKDAVPEAGQKTKKQMILDHCVSGNGQRRWLIVKQVGCSLSYYMRIKSENGLRDYDDIAGPM